MLACIQSIYTCLHGQKHYDFVDKRVLYIAGIYSSIDIDMLSFYTYSRREDRGPKKSGIFRAEEPTVNINYYTR